MTNHIAICKVHNSQIVCLFCQFCRQSICYFKCRHLWLQVVCSYFWRVNQYAVFVFVWSFTTTVQEECYVSIFLSLSNMQLTSSCFRYHFAQCVFYILFVENNIYAYERSIVWSHTVVVQFQCFHSLFWHIFLSQHLSQFFCAVITIVEENHHVAIFDCSYRFTFAIYVYDRFNKFISNLIVVRFLYSSHSICRSFTYAIH